MLLVRNDGTEPRLSLALEEWLCLLSARVGEAFFMLWRNGPCVVVGRFQNVRAEVNLPLARSLRIPVLRRNSGGGAVYHDLGNVNYSFIRPDRGEGLAFFADRIVRALGRAGVEAEFSLERNDIELEGRKISGMARYCHGGTLLCHGTLLFDCDLDAMGRILTVPAEKLRRKGVKSIRSRVANLKSHCSRAADTEAFMGLLGSEFRGLGEYALSPQDWDGARRLAEEKYAACAWNFEGRDKERIIDDDGSASF